MTTLTLLDAGAGPITTLSLEAATHDERVLLDATAVQKQLGWTLKPEGLCRGEVCIPVRDREALVREGRIDLEVFAGLVGRPLALDREEALAALGESADVRAAQLATLEAPDFSLPDLDGVRHSLSAHRGKKVLLIAYASW